MKNKFNVFILSIIFIFMACISVQAVTDWNRAVRDGVLTETKMMLKTGSDSGTSISIASNEITVNASFIILDTEGNVTDDILSTMNAGLEVGRWDAVQDGDMVVLRQENATRDIQINTSGNIELAGYSSITLGTLSDYATFHYDEGRAKWVLKNFTNSDGIEGLSIDNSPIGATTASTGVFTNVTANVAFITSLTVTGSITQGEVIVKRLAIELDDDAEIALPAGTGILRVFVEGDNEYASFHIQDDGTVITASVLKGDVDSLDTDAKLCVYDAGAVANIKNRLAAAKTIIYEFIYK